MKKVAVVTDSNAGIRQKEAKELGIFVLPMPFTIDDQTYYEDINLTHEEFFEKQLNGAEIFTSQPVVGNVKELWDQILKDYDEENDEDDFYFHWHVDRISKGYVKHSVEIIDKVENDRVYEEHYQKTYDVETYIELLEKIGFKNIKLYSDFSKYGTECERVIFVCQKG